jgi:thioredoxin-like negative regulator of GroEL
MSQALDVSQYPIMILVFGMDGCPACSTWLPLFRAAAQRNSDVPAFAVDCNKQPDAADHYKIRVTPTTVILSYGRVLVKHEGAGTQADAEKVFRDARASA